MKAFLRFILGLIAGSIATYIIGSIINSQFVMNAYGVPISFGDRFNMTMFDISNMLLYLVVIAIALLIAFSIAAVLKRFLPRLAAVAYPIAGAAAIGVALGLMYILAQTIPISGARSIAGYLGQVLAGAFGGYVFAKIYVQPKILKA